MNNLNLDFEKASIESSKLPDVLIDKNLTGIKRDKSLLSFWVGKQRFFRNQVGGKTLHRNNQTGAKDERILTEGGEKGPNHSLTF